ncbi:hypothetical protein [Streptomyces griseocarneus]|uniref:hypothetical protein n=1 Tax=Streptomyces griseocarneus TaxID=51201 RepID=UPI00167E9984|nr:hypothetical protein [Streptomyces griseocarneus]MBZ6474733.1 hypothetical protein [Streptomyces griseocarneus]GHG47832.1 hypothetical protein GCM10018779_05510 [Streptomyces griseocarneus]
MVRVLKWVAFTVIAVQLTLVATGVLDLADAVLIATGVEILTGVLALGLAVAARVVYRRLRRSGVPRWDAFLEAAGTVLPRPMLTLIRHELGGVMSIALLVRGRKDVPADATVIRYGANQKIFLLVMMFTGPLEIFLAELLVPWPWLRTVLLILGIYGVLWLFGVYAGVHTRPHYIDGERLMIRTGHLAAVSVDVGAVRSVRRETHDSYQGEKAKGMVSVKDGVVAVPGMSGTVLAVALGPETPVRVQGRGTVLARALRFDADELESAIRTIKERVEARSL